MALEATKQKIFERKDSNENMKNWVRMMIQLIGKKKRSHQNLPANFLIILLHIRSLSILYVCFCAFSRRLWLFNDLNGLMLELVRMLLNYVYPSILFIFVQKRCISQQNNVPLSRVCHYITVFTFHSDEILHYSLIFSLCNRKKLENFQCYFKRGTKKLCHTIFLGREGEEIEPGADN